MYGQYQFISQRTKPPGKFGETISLGWTVGEEILYDDNELDGIRRRESCISVTDSCLI